jgi:hypothetical protein
LPLAKTAAAGSLLAQMGLALALRELSRRRRLLALGVLVAAIAAVLSVYRLDGLALKSRSLQYSSASTQALVDASSSVLGNLSQASEDLSTRAAVYANFMASPAVLSLVGQQVGLSGDQIYAAGPVNANEPRVEQEPTALKRNVEITGETVPYRLNFESQSSLPTINIYAQAPTTPQAVALANAAVVGLQRYVTSLENEDKVPAASRITIRQLGPANGAVVDGGISKQLAVMVFVAIFLLWCVLMLVGPRFRGIWRESAILQQDADDRARRIEPGEEAAEVSVHAPYRGRARDLGDESALFDLPSAPPSARDIDRPVVPARSTR